MVFISSTRDVTDLKVTSSLVTVIITTSPMISDPEPDILEKVLKSLSLAGLSDCRTILVMDYFVPGEPRKRRLCGRISAERIAAYEKRVATVFESIQSGSLFGNNYNNTIEVLRLESWHGFALAVKRALKEVKTSLVCIVQHDLVFRRKIDIIPLLNILQEEGNGVNYIYFKRDAQKNYREKARSLHRLEIGPPKSFGDATTSLIRLPRYFDGTHIARTEWYSKFLDMTKFKPGQFIDQSIGKQMLQKATEHTEFIDDIDGDKVSRGVHDVCTTHGCWMWCNEEEPLIEHLNGRTHLGKTELKLRKQNHQKT